MYMEIDAELCDICYQQPTNKRPTDCYVRKEGFFRTLGKIAFPFLLVLSSSNFA